MTKRKCRGTRHSKNNVGFIENIAHAPHRTNEINETNVLLDMLSATRERRTTMQQVICPLDNRPCELDCPDRYKDQPGGGCFLTTAQELGATILALGGNNAGILFAPRKENPQ